MNILFFFKIIFMLSYCSLKNHFRLIQVNLTIINHICKSASEQEQISELWSTLCTHWNANHLLIHYSIKLDNDVVDQNYNKNEDIIFSEHDALTLE